MLIAFLASLAIFLLDSRLNYLSSFRAVLATFAYPIQSFVSFPSITKDWASDFFSNHRELRAKNTALQKANLLSSVRLQKLQALEQENKRLRTLLGSSFRLNEQVIFAELLTVNLDPFSQQVIIDKGGLYDVFPGQPVLDATGVMGQITSVSPLSSTAILLTDPSHALPVQNNRNGVRAVLTGRGFGKPLQIDYLPHNADIRIGDLLVTSGLGGRFPAGYPVGTIIAINLPPGKAFTDVKVEPAAQLATSREVLLVMSAKRLPIDHNAISAGLAQ